MLTAAHQAALQEMPECVPAVRSRRGPENDHLLEPEPIAAMFVQTAQQTRPAPLGFPRRRFSRPHVPDIYPVVHAAKARMRKGQGMLLAYARSQVSNANAKPV